MATLIVKCIERCNSNCVYCDVSKSHAGIPDMPPDTLETVFYRINEYLSDRAEEIVLFTWHGGEPLLLGPDYFELAMRLQEKQCSRTRDRITHSIQSNLTLLSEELIFVLKGMGIDHIGSSYDPEPHVRGPGSDVDSASYNRSFLKATGLLERHDMSWGLIYVITSKSLADPLGTFTLLTNLLSGRGLMLNPVVISDPDRQGLAVTPEEYADFLGEIFPLWYGHQERFPNVEPFLTLCDYLAGRKKHLFCTDSGECGRSHLNIDPMGNVSKCGRSSDLHILELGNIHEHSIATLLDKSDALLSGRIESLRQGDCKDCDLFPICHGGCPIDGYIAHGSFLRKTSWCEAKRRFIRNYFEPVTGNKIGSFSAQVEN